MKPRGAWPWPAAARLGAVLALAILPLAAMGFDLKSDQYRITSITQAPVAGLYKTAWALALLCFVIAIGREQARVFGGETPRPMAALGRTAVVVLALALYGPFCQFVWNVSAWIAEGIVSEEEVNGLALAFKTLVVHAFTAVMGGNGDYGGLLMSTLRNAILGLCMDLMIWGVSWAVDAIRIVQVCLFNVTVMFGPICLALHVSGLRTGQIWLMALLEICAWNITIAIVFWTLQHRIASEFLDIARQSLVQFDWWRDMKELSFMASLIFFVPIITARFFGFAALGEISRAALGNDANMAIGSALTRWGSWRDSPQVQGGPSLSHDGSSQHRAGD